MPELKRTLRKTAAPKKTNDIAITLPMSGVEHPHITNKIAILIGVVLFVIVGATLFFTIRARKKSEETGLSAQVKSEFISTVSELPSNEQSLTTIDKSNFFQAVVSTTDNSQTRSVAE